MCVLRWVDGEGGREGGGCLAQFWVCEMDGLGAYRHGCFVDIFFSSEGFLGAYSLYGVVGWLCLSCFAAFSLVFGLITYIVLEQVCIHYESVAGIDVWRF